MSTPRPYLEILTAEQVRLIHETALRVLEEVGLWMPHQEILEYFHEAGAKADEVYQAWQARVDAAGLSHYRRHHCGYMVRSAFPPAWSGGGVPIGLRRGSSMILRAGMVFHLLSWLMGTGRAGDYFISDATLVTEDGCEVLTKASQQVRVV
ncbi:MAG: M24 family metallopeptidase [Chloroflexi bacterium]|nr:M24 family metallopeptidase [Chloroflexota bacterium]